MGDHTPASRRRASRFTIGSIVAALTVGSAIASAVPAAAQTNIGVYVAYADSVRANATNFPTPWLGSPNTIFEGCAPVASCTYDAGAIRVVNNSPSSVTVNSIAVHIDTCTYTGWAPAALAPGADLIVTQLATGFGAGCTGPDPASFDTSDIGPGGISNVGNCTGDGLIPSVDITIDGLTTSYPDSGQVLNTGGIDPGDCNQNESTQWTKIGSQPCKGSILSLAPAAQTDQILSTAALTATFTNSCGQPLSNVNVLAAAFSGPNQGLTRSGTTDADGAYPFNYSSTKLGTDLWQASVSNLAGTILSNHASVTWIVNFAPGGGAFVISDLKDLQGGAVYWWGAQWWKNDHLSTGLGPASFKGFADSPSSPWCGQTWTTRPGNSSRPPKAIAADSDMAVIVSSNITKSGPTITGDIVAIVLVRTNPGYGPNPGHPGTGTIIATLCSQTAAQPAPQASTSIGPNPAATPHASVSNRPAGSPTSTPLPTATTSGQPAPVATTSTKPGNGKGSGAGQRDHGRGH